MKRIPTNRRPTTPGEMLVAEFLQPSAIAHQTFADRVGLSLADLEEIIEGKQRITVSVAQRFAEALGTSHEWWLNMQFDVDAYDAAATDGSADAR